jgi:hypothetical protein
VIAFAEWAVFLRMEVYATVRVFANRSLRKQFFISDDKVFFQAILWHYVMIYKLFNKTNPGAAGNMYPQRG